MSTRPLRVVTSGTLPASFPTASFDGRIRLQIADTPDALRDFVRQADVLYSGRVPDIVPAETPDLRWIQLPSAGADHLRHLPVWNSNITITSSRGIHTVPMSEHVFAMLLALVRQIPALVQAQEGRDWLHDLAERDLAFGEVRGRTMGIVGMGKIGDGVAHLAHAFGMRVIGTRRSVTDPQEIPEAPEIAFSDPPWLEPVENGPDMVYPATELDEVLAQSDVVVVILPLTSQTRGLLGEAEFRAMKQGALFLNIGRGAVVQEDALVRALQSGQLGGAGLDVFSEEPLPKASPLWSMPHVLISPHVGGMSDRTRERAAHFFAVNLVRYLDGEPLLNVVDRKQEY